VQRCRLVAEERRAGAAVRHADGAGGVGVAIRFAPAFVELRAPRLEARTLNAEDGLRAIEIGVAERASRQSIQSATSQTLVASLRLLFRRQVHVYDADTGETDDVAA
jgi:hypothetical protein